MAASDLNGPVREKAPHGAFARLGLALVGGLALLVAANATGAPRALDKAKWEPPAATTLHIASLGRLEAAADILWLELLQLIGSDAYTRARYPHLEDWIALIGESHPRLEGPFYFATVLLLGDPQRRPHVQELLALAESRNPNDFRYPLERGVVEYFGNFDALKAADHLERAAARPGAPPYIAAFAATLRKRGVQCATISAEASGFARNDVAIADRTLECLKQRIAGAMAMARVAEDPADSVEALVAHGHLPADALPEGACWALTPPATVELVPCPTTNP